MTTGDFFDLPDSQLHSTSTRTMRIWKALGEASLRKGEPKPSKAQRHRLSRFVFVQASTHLIAERVARAHFRNHRTRLSCVIPYTWEEYAREFNREASGPACTVT